MARPRRFSSPEQMQGEIDKYFELCDSRVKQVYDKSSQTIKGIPSPIPYTIEGLCNVLEVSRQTLLNYESFEEVSEFFDTVKKAKAKVQQNMVERGLDGDNNPAITIFLLKNNNGYVDKVETENKTTVIGANFTLSELDTNKKDFASNESAVE